MKRWFALALLAAALAAVAASPAMATQTWHSEQPLAASGVPEPLGAVGDIEFEAPNRGALITPGVGGVPGGVYIYDGVAWHLYSTVCGGHNGRIAWAGPEDFWTISDQPAGQGGVFGAGETSNRSLCHFVGGRVVASYAEPIGVAGSYSRMNAAACSGPDDCWFAGERLGGTNTGAFHLHWNGQTLTAVPSLTRHEPELGDPGRTIGGLAFNGGQLFESVQVQGSDGEIAGESEQPSFIHRIEPGVPHPFEQLFTPTKLEYGNAESYELEAFHFASLGSELLAIAGSVDRQSATPALLRFEAGRPVQVPLEAGEVFEPQTGVAGAAGEPGTDHLWVSYRRPDEHLEDGSVPARLAAVRPDGSVAEAIELPRGGEGIGRKGSAGPLACPALEQCWMATEKGWLFHLGGALEPDTDPAFAGTITYRPPDDSIPVLPPAELPIDDSGAGTGTPKAAEETLREPFPHNRRPRKLISKVKQSLVHKTVLKLAFTLYASAHVQLIAERKKQVVAKTKRLTLPPGRHTLLLRLDPKRFPTHLDFEVHPSHRSKK